MSDKIQIDVRKIQKIINLLSLASTIDDSDIVEVVIESVVEMLQEEINSQNNK